MSRSSNLLPTLYSPKQEEVMRAYHNEDFYILINTGGIRSGKTVVNNDIFLNEVMRVSVYAKENNIKTPMYILAGATSGTLYTNVLLELTNKYGIEFKFDRYGNFMLFGVLIVTTHTGNIGGLRSIRGMESYGAYVNEASLANHEVFGEIINRCSGTGARIICDTNPDHPNHWLKKDYIDQAREKPEFKVFHWTIFDNPFLSDDYVSNRVATIPTGAMYDRAILGRWTAGEGAIYVDFNQETMTIPAGELPDMERYVVGVDWGYRHYGAMVVLGIRHGAYYVVEENVHQHLHIDDWVEIAKRIQTEYGHRVPFYADSARAEYVEALYMNGINSHNAKDNVLAGISEVASLMTTDKFFVVDTAEKTLEELGVYEWQETADKPVKANDDALDAIRYAIFTDKEESAPFFH